MILQAGQRIIKILSFIQIGFVILLKTTFSCLLDEIICLSAQQNFKSLEKSIIFKVGTFKIHMTQRLIDNFPVPTNVSCFLALKKQKRGWLAVKCVLTIEMVFIVRSVTGMMHHNWVVMWSVSSGGGSSDLAIFRKRQVEVMVPNPSQDTSMLSIDF